MTYQDMSDVELLEEIQLHIGDSPSIAICCAVPELATRFKAKVEEVKALKSDNDCFDKVVKELRSELAGETDKIAKEILDAVISEITIWAEFPEFNDIAKASLENEHNIACLKYVINEVLVEHVV